MENTWDKLPWHLQFMVLKRLPTSDLSRLQFSCNYFKSLLSDLEFVIEYDKNRSAHTPLYIQARRDLWESGVNVGQHWTLTAYGDGLLCYHTDLRPSGMQRIFRVYNPLFPGDANSRILMAPTADYSRKSISEMAGIAFDRKNGVSKLVLCQESYVILEHRSERTTFVYNFKELTWKQVPESKENKNNGQIGPPLNANAQIVNERLLCWLTHEVRFLSIPYMVLLFDLEEEAWLDPIPLRHQLFVPLCIAEHENEVCVVGRTYRMMELRLLKFDMQQKVWRSEEHISAPPPPPPPSLWRRHDLMGGRGVVMWIEEHKKDVTMQRLWVYEMSRHCWECLGTLPALTDIQYHRGGRFCFESSLFR